MDGRGRCAEREPSALPPWVVDPRVKCYLESENIELTIVDDERYRRGNRGMPLVILCRIRPPDQYIIG